MNRGETTQKFQRPSISIQPLSPPDNFSILNATDEELKKYGIPSRPKDPEKLEIWKSNMKYAKHYVKPEQKVTDDVHFNKPKISNALNASNTVNTIYNGNNGWGWLGYVAPNSANGYKKFCAVSGQWNEPTNMLDTYLSYWVGIDGTDGSNDVVQAGTGALV